MKTSNITKSALALALGLCASGAWAATVTPVSEDFEGAAFDNGINGVATNNLTWADTEGYSAVSGGKLVVDAAETPTSATITNTVANNINGAFGARNAKFNATVTFVPATDDPVVTGDDLKFALYAKAVTGATNLYVIANGGAQPTGITLSSVTDQNVEVAFTAADTFTVKVGTDTSSAFTFANSGDISKLEFSGNGEVEALSFSYDLASITLEWPTNNISSASYTIGGEAGNTLPINDGHATIYGNVGDAIVLTIQNGDGVTKIFNGTVGTDSRVGNFGYAYTWADYLGEAVNGAYAIDNLAELKLFQKGVASGLVTANTTFTLTTDVTLDAAWEGIGIQNGKDIYNKTAFNNGAFCGVFDGQNHTISGFQMIAGLDYCGFFNSTYQATIRNLKIQYGGNLFATNTAQNTDECGGTFVGVAKTSTLVNLTTVAGSVSCSKGFGGIVGYTTCGTTVDSCTNNLNVTSLKPNKAGGIAMIVQNGSATNIIRNCQNNGTTTGSEEHGGLVGYVQADLIIDGCESTVSDQLFNHYANVVIVQGVNKANANSVSYIKHSGQTPADFDGLHFATVVGDTATFVYDGGLAAGNTYKVMSAGATATFAFAEAGTIAFNTALATPTYAITAPGLKLTENTADGVKTYTARAYATPTVSYSTELVNLTAAWTVDGSSVEGKPATITEDVPYSVTFTAASGYVISDPATATVSGTAGTEDIVIPVPAVVVAYAEEQDITIGTGEGSKTHELTATEADYLNGLVAEKGATEVTSKLETVTEDDFTAAALLNQDITEANAGSYEFNVTKIKKSGGTVKVTVKLTRSGTLIGGINGTLVLQTCATPTGTYADAQTLDIDGTAFAGTAAEATAEFTFTGVTGDSNKFFKAVIR